MLQIKNTARGKYKSSLQAYLFLLPAFLLFTIFVLKPVSDTIGLSFFQWDGVNPVKDFVGLDNYVKALGDSRLYHSFINNLIWLLLLVTVPLIIGLPLAVALTNPCIRMRDKLQALYFIPYVISPVVVALIWVWIYSPSIGLLTPILEALGLVENGYGILGDKRFALTALIGTQVWTLFGFCTIIYVNALEAIDPELYDACRIDGANSFQSFRNITIPGVSSVTTFLVLLNMINSFKVFDQVFLMTKGGPVNATEVSAYLMYVHAFRLDHVGYGSALSVLLSIVVLALGSVYINNREQDDNPDAGGTV